MLESVAQALILGATWKLLDVITDHVLHTVYNPVVLTVYIIKITMSSSG